LCNRFPIRSTNDALFYILATLSELSISPEKAFVKLFGELGADGQLLAILSEYVTNVELGDFQTVKSLGGGTDSEKLYRNERLFYCLVRDLLLN
jgi:hypothetical protein